MKNSKISARDKTAGDKNQKSKISTELKNEISWRAANSRYVKKGPVWYIGLTSISLILIIIALSQRNFFFAFFILLAAFTIFYSSRRRPQTEEFKINEEGVGFGKEIFYRYDGLEAFSIYERPFQLNEIVLKKKAVFNPYVRIPIDFQLAPQAKKILSQKLAEFDYKPSMIDILADWLGL